MEEVLSKYFPEIDSLYDYQRNALDSIFNGENILSIVPTGGGKSLIYQAGAMGLAGTTIVISPLKALMNEQVSELRDVRKLNAIAISSDSTFQEQRRILRSLAEKKPKIIYVSPERLHNYFFRSALMKSGIDISLLAIDESHCISQWGIDFRPDYARIKSFIRFLHENNQHPVILGLTATLGKKPREDIKTEFHIDKEIIETSVIRDNLVLNFQQVENDESKLPEMKKFIEVHDLKKVLIYTYNRKKCEELSTEFEEGGYFHAGLSNKEKTEVYNQFKAGKIKVLCATTAFGMGMNIPDIDGVIHYQIPESVEEYYQHVGRGARDKEKCPVCQCLFLWSDKNFQYRESEINADVLTAEKLDKAFERFNPRGGSNTVVQMNTEELYENDGKRGTLNLKQILDAFERHGLFEIIGEVNGKPLSIKFKQNTVFWDEMLKEIGRRNNFLFAAKKIGPKKLGTEKIEVALHKIIDHVYEEELKGNIDKIPAEKQTFLYANASGLQEEIKENILAENERVKDYKLSLLHQLKELTTFEHKETYIAQVLDV